MADETRMDAPDSGRRGAPQTRLDRTGTSAAPTRLDDPGSAAHSETAPRPPAPQTRIDSSPHDAFQPLPPALASRFTVQRKLGSGGEATVWLCRATNGHDFAIKLFHQVPRYRVDFEAPQYRNSFRAEHSVRVFERGSDLDIHFEVMEYCRFGSLDSFLRQRDPHGGAADLAVEVLRQLATKLHALQRPDGGTLVHGDVNPRNILVRSDSPLELVLADFGLAVDLGGRSKITNTGQGTAAYSAPGAPQRWRVEDDWWSVGMVLYRVLVGRGYFEDDAGRQLADSTIDAEVNTRDISLAALDDLALRPAMRSRWQRLLTGLLTRDPRQRWGFTEVEAWLAGKAPAVHRAAPNAEEPASRARRALMPFALPGVGTFHDSASLGAAMAGYPEPAARALAGRGRAALLNWLVDDVRTGDSYAELKSYGDGWGPEELATYFTAKLAPTAALTYRGHAVDTVADLCGLATAFDAAEVVTSLYDRQLVGSLSGPHRSNYPMIDADWRDIVQHADELGEQYGFDIRFGRAPQRTHVIRYALLLAAGDEAVADSFVAGVRHRLADPNMASANEVSWFAQLRQEARL